MKDQPILVIGATGKTGSRVASHLEARGLHVRRGSRSSATPFDWEAPETWAPALRGARAAYVTYFPDLAFPGAVEKLESLCETARDVVIIDTAGRMHIDEQMMQEVADIKTAVTPNETLFVVDSMTGQDAVNTAKEFNNRLDYDGVVLTKLDGDTRGGAALSIRTVVEKPIKFASTGEKLEALTPFYPDRMAQRILGMGDVVSFVERAQEEYDQKEAERLEEKIRSDEFDLQDFYDQLQRIQNMGSLKELMGMIPGVGNKIQDLDIDEEAFTHIEAIIQSMTPEERAHPDILNGTRRRRIARGSGNEVRDVNQLVSQFEEMKDMMKTMQKMTSQGRDVDMSSLMDKITGGGGGQSRSPR